MHVPETVPYSRLPLTVAECGVDVQSHLELYAGRDILPAFLPDATSYCMEGGGLGPIERPGPQRRFKLTPQGVIVSRPPTHSLQNPLQTAEGIQRPEPALILQSVMQGLPPDIIACCHLHPTGDFKDNSAQA
ncbi:hypothetical protein GCM10012320_34330 [Sinomonas cellulolyticus]|nr:hypothetical protein GCM10012320_34330 [Sinomonas sp. KCTC 49339]